MFSTSKFQLMVPMVPSALNGLRAAAFALATASGVPCFVAAATSCWVSIGPMTTGLASCVPLATCGEVATFAANVASCVL